MFEAIIPLRSKSRGLINKNILPFKNNVNLVNHTLNKLIKIKKIKKIYILTDSVIYKKKIIQHEKIDVNYLRKKKYSTSKSKIDDLIKDFLKNYNNNQNNKKFLLFQVTSPNLGKKEIIKTINFIIKKKISSLMHVTNILENPYEVIETNKKKWKFLMKKRLVNRQNYPKKFMFITGSLYFFTRDFFLKYQELINSRTYPYKVDRINFVDIDDLFTFQLSKQVSTLKIRD